MGVVNLSMFSNKNYFEVFGFPVTPDIDIDALRNSWHSLQQKHHPDRRIISEDDVSSRINSAYNTLRDPFERIRYILSLHSALPTLEDELSIPTEFLEAHMKQQEVVFNGSYEQRMEVAEILSKDESSLRDKLFSDIRSANWDNARQNFMKWSFLLKTQQRLTELLDR